MDYSAYHWSEKARKYAETIGTIFNVKGRVNTISDLPSTGNKVGDLWLVGLTTDPDLTEYAWLSFDNVTRWEKLGSTATSLAFSAITGSPNDNVALKNALDGKYSTSNPDGYISGITSAMVTTALGYTPYNSSNPSGYTSNVGTVTSVNNTTPDSSGNVNITIPDPLPSQTGQSGKFLTTDGTDASWATVDALPSQTGNSGKYLTTNGTSASWSIPKTNDLFDFKWTDYELSDQSWLRADTFSWQDGTVYSDAYNHLVDDIDGKTASTETINGTTVTYYLADDGHKIVDVSDVSAIETVYSSTGVAWYYVLDTANQRFKLPRTKFGFTGFRDAVGKFVSPTLPNITGGFKIQGNESVTWGNSDLKSGSGAFQTKLSGSDDYRANINVSSGQTSRSSSQTNYADFNASRSSSIYQNSATVQPPATQMYLYFYVGQFTQSATEQTAGLNSGLFNGKVDLNAANLSTAGKSLISGLGMPSTTYENLTYGGNTDFHIAPANGFVLLDGSNSGSNGLVQIIVSYSTSTTTSEIENNRLYQSAQRNSAGVSVFIPIKKGYTFTAKPWSGTLTVSSYKFIYAEGEV